MKETGSKLQSGVRKGRRRWSLVRREKRYNLICDVPVRSQTKPCTTEVLPLFLIRSKQKGEENGWLFISKQKKTWATLTYSIHKYSKITYTALVLSKTTLTKTQKVILVHSGSDREHSAQHPGLRGCESSTRCVYMHHNHMKERPFSVTSCSLEKEQWRGASHLNKQICKYK